MERVLSKFLLSNVCSQKGGYLKEGLKREFTVPYNINAGKRKISQCSKEESRYLNT